MSQKFKVEQLFISTWDDAGWTVDDKPQRFDSVEEAEAAIREFVRDTEEAVAQGNMSSGHTVDEFRVVPDTRVTTLRQDIEELLTAAEFAATAMQNMRTGTFRGATARIRRVVPVVRMRLSELESQYGG